MLPILAKHFHVTVDYLLNIGGNAMKTIEAERLLIREWSEHDAAALLEIKIKQESTSFMNYLKITALSDSMDTVKIWKEYREMYPVILKATGKLIGVAGLVDVNRYKGYRELEVSLCDAYNDADHLTEAHRLILSYGFDELGLLTAFAYCGRDDAALQQAMSEVGFVYEGTLRRFGRDMSDRLRYSLTGEEYRR
jgi:ribosomal-protein-alanine N-acetyltransferase